MLLDNPLLILSVHTGIDNSGINWLTIQHDFIKRHTKNFVHSICLINNQHHTPDNIKIIANINSNLDGGHQHLQGLNILCDFAKQNIDNYRSFLILDSDCFPIRNWEDQLTRSMYHYQKDIACIIRTENFDQFAHPAAVYTNNADLLKFDYRTTTNMLGQQVNDNQCLTTDFLPLIRTNRHNIHPIAFGIYSDSFYHHGAGSRKPIFRGDEYYNKKYINMNSQFALNPNKFIDNLC